MQGLKIGTCSWKYPSWSGLVYSKPKGINYLQEYSRNYGTVEVDQWFWSLFDGSPVALPKSATVEEYVQSVPEDFKFTVKVPNSITLTHYYKKAGDRTLKTNPNFLSIELFQDFLDRLAPMHPYLDVLMFQFEYLNKKKMTSQMEFLRKLDDFFSSAPQGFACALEPRNPGWLDGAYFKFVEERNLAHVFIQGYYMPDITGIYWKHKENIKNTTVIRLHGPNRLDIERKTGEKWAHIVNPRDDEIARVVEMIDDLLSRGVGVALNVNNHYEGSSPLTIEKLKRMLDSKGLP